VTLTKVYLLKINQAGNATSPKQRKLEQFEVLIIKVPDYMGFRVLVKCDLSINLNPA
jgi:hypothetical protein